MRPALGLGAALVCTLLACGGSNSNVSACPGPACVCAGSACACQSGTSCSWAPDGGSSSLTCASAAQCSGTCANNCDASCRSNSTCTLTMGNSANLSCDNSNCTFTLGVSATVSCTNGATCSVTC